IFIFRVKCTDGILHSTHPLYLRKQFCSQQRISPDLTPRVTERFDTQSVMVSEVFDICNYGEFIVSCTEETGLEATPSLQGRLDVDPKSFHIFIPKQIQITNSGFTDRKKSASN
ncbi:MAG TPA: hypothetical protein VJ987_00920, partial [Anaerolineales bacterium]|nr:hypothetical protein [Anaerolineales bacterium]